LFSSRMLFTTAICLSTFAWALCSLSVETSTESAALFLDFNASSTSPYPTSDGPALAVRLRSDDHGEDQPPSEQLNSPKQVCPTDPPIDCYRPNCLGSPDPPNAYRCKSRSITIIDSVETTLFGCPCCPGSNYFDCDDEICDGEETARCTTELLKGCHCRSRNPSTPYLCSPVDICVDPNSPVLGPIQERSTTPTEPPPPSSEFWNVSDKGYEDTPEHGMPQKDGGNEMLPRTAPVVWLDSYD
jgi:hypothetical protein